MEWRQLSDSEGTTWYQNIVTGETAWDIPQWHEVSECMQVCALQQCNDGFRIYVCVCVYVTG